MCIPRVTVPVMLEGYGYRFELGKAKMIPDGADVLFISTGLTTTRTLLAAKRLEKLSDALPTLRDRYGLPVDQACKPAKGRLG
ncbi:MAG: hypothetical protein OEU92_13735 [Alphaproteobacteria bacterium]|nr:hypothetical protein [Alphaproteobacteria bacterium]